MYLVPYTAPSAKTKVTRYQMEGGFATVPANEERVWTIIYNPEAKAVRVTLGTGDEPSFEIPPQGDRVLPSPSYLGVIRCDGPVIVTELLKNA